MKPNTLLFVLILSLTAFAEEDFKWVKISKGLPKDVKSWIERRVACNYQVTAMPKERKGEVGKDFTQEELEYDEYQKEEVKKNMRAYKCSHLDAQENEIKKKYKGNDKVLSAVKESKKLKPGD